MSAIETAISRLLTVFGNPKTGDPDLYIEEFAKALKGTDPMVLEKAVDRWIKRDTPFWPRPGELLAEVERVASDLYNDKRRAEHKPFAPQTVDEAAIARVRAMVSKAIEAMQAEGHVVGKASETQWERGREREFRAMQERSRSPHLHQAKGLTDTSKRITGERD